MEETKVKSRLRLQSTVNNTNKLKVYTKKLEINGTTRTGSVDQVHW